MDRILDPQDIDLICSNLRGLMRLLEDVREYREHERLVRLAEKPYALVPVDEIRDPFNSEDVQ